GAVMGTATYFSPEQAEGMGVDARTDIYSLGVVLFEMLTGRPPVLGDTPVSVASKHVRDIPPTPRELLETIPVELEAVTMKAMAKVPDQRYPNAEEFRADLLRFIEGQPVEAGPPNGAGATTGIMGAIAATESVSTVQRTQAFPRPGRKRETTGQRRRGGWGWLALLAVLLAGVAVVAYLLVSTFTGGFALPNVVGKPEAQAEQVLTSKGLVIGTTTNRADPSAAGTVLSTNPPAGTHVAKKAVVSLVVSAGEVEVKVPSVVGDELGSAEATITNAGLSYKVRFVASGAQQGAVLSQDPPAGASIRKGRTVTISIPEPTNQVQVPNLTGLSAQAAAAQLSATSLSVGSQANACSNSFPANEVSGSSPAAGTEVGRNSQVNLTISSGPCQVVVRRVVGESSSQATSDLQGQGLTVAADSTQTCDPSNNGNVVAQSPPGGTQVTLPATDTITVCSSPVSTTTLPAGP
ncbi:MAG: PASTA domain-containing protein, partial [Acidimicrobiales bacterium]